MSPGLLQCPRRPKTHDPRPLRTFLLASAALTLQAVAAGLPKLDFGAVREERVMIPMRDGQKLSAYLYFPPGEGKWPAIFEQRYAEITGTGSRQASAKWAERGFVIAVVNYRGTHESEGVWRGYRGLEWGELRDGYDVCEWLAAQPWCTGKIGTYGGSQAGYAQNYLAVSQPPHLVAQYMTDNRPEPVSRGLPPGRHHAPRAAVQHGQGRAESRRPRRAAARVGPAPGLRRLLAR
ncbi:MAG: CocE/NonD family hydrolase [Chthoniobacter sp.]